MMKPRLFGEDDIIALASFRYCLGRHVYIVSDYVEWLMFYWNYLESETRKIIKYEISEAIDERSAGSSGCVKKWQEVLALPDEMHSYDVNPLVL